MGVGPSRDDRLVGHLLGHVRLPSDGVLIVHSGIRDLGRQGYRAERLIDAMIARLPHGTVLMPTMTWRTVNQDQPVFDGRRTPSHTGVMTELFRTTRASARSLHPTHSVAATGSLAADLTRSHHSPGQDGYLTPCSETSPYGRLYRQGPRDGTFILLLGVTLESCTAIHLAEEIVAPDLYLKPPDASEPYTLIDETGTGRVVLNRRHARLPRDFSKFGPPLAARGRLQSGTIGATPWSLVSLHDLLDLVFAALAQHADSTLARTTPSWTVPLRP